MGTEKLTQRYIDRLSLPAAGQRIIRDAELKGFGVRVTSGGASFIESVAATPS